MKTCPCELHCLPLHPNLYQDARQGIWFGALNIVCWCECDHTPDEKRWAA